MEAIRNHTSIIESYKNFLKSFFRIEDPRIREKVEEELNNDSYLPKPLIQFNPSYKKDVSLSALTENIHPELEKIIGNYTLYHHQVEAIQQGVSGKGFIVTSGTGSGKSLTFLATIFNGILQKPTKGVRAIIVYPMNALINSQEEEIMKYEINWHKAQLPPGTISTQKSLTEQLQEAREKSRKTFPITYRKYTGQESNTTKEEIREQEPHIILTNYMMLELIMTRYEEKAFREKLSTNLKYLAFDELHTYRGRQGADVAMLIRRIKNITQNKIITIGTSATMSSEGSTEDKKHTIAKVASLIFDETYTPEQIIGEKLDTSTAYTGTDITPEQLATAIDTPILPEDTVGKFQNHPLAIWLETRIALKRDNETGEFQRNTPLKQTEIASLLSRDSKKDIHSCENALQKMLAWIEQLNITGAQANPKQSYLPFKLHQFISQTGIVKVTLDNKNDRHITLDDENYIHIEGKDRPLYPVLFSRYSGVDFLCVKLGNGRLQPRDPDNPDDQPIKITQNDVKGDKETGRPPRTLSIDDFKHGYLIIQEKGEEDIWKDEHTDYLPDSWFKTNRGNRGEIKNYYQYRLPQLLHFNSEGQYSWKQEDHLPLKGWYIPANLLFDPTSGIIFDLKTSENTKLARLGNEGRSSATTILGASILKTLQENNTPSQNRKFLSFTDNRQDASLQAGHFNDFFTLARLRSAIYHAVKKHPEGLDSSNIALKVFDELNLRETEYARNPSCSTTWKNEKNSKALQKYLMIRILYDLKLGWRYTTPNLEQTALINIQYYRLNEFANCSDLFKDTITLSALSAEERKQTIIQILNYFRTSFAFDHLYLVEKRDEVETEIKNILNLKTNWSLDFDEKIEAPYVLLTNPNSNIRTKEYIASIGSKSYLGKYIRRLYKELTGLPIRQDDLTQEIENICKVLETGNFITSVKIGKNPEITGYRIRIDNIIWKTGDEKNIAQDKVRFAQYKQTSLYPNPFFQNFYKQDFKQFDKPIEGKEHTGQLNNSDRMTREEDFREGKLSALFCSPTMELGIDINQLSIVHQRNVPPRPDNYAQRSGRAGRSGQSALIYTFCSKRSPHDRNYFKSPEKMVHGIVVPPKLDLTNEELVRTHLDAYILMELSINMRLSVIEVIDIDTPKYPINPDIQTKIEEILTHYAHKWEKQFEQIIQQIPDIKNTNWYSPNWLNQQVNSFLKRFDNAFTRWRTLYKNTTEALNNAHLIISTPNHPGIKEARRTYNVAQRQRDLLINKNESSSGNESEFYIFRYLASEGFLPGYNFTRLPVRAYMGKKAADQGEYISRPRFIALREFGPNNLVYHNGSKYKIIQMQLNQEKGELLETIKISKETGYAFIGAEATNVNNDPITHKELSGTDTMEKYKNVVKLNESEAHIDERISCNEENRVSQGYDIKQYFTFSKGAEKVRKATIKTAEHPLLEVIYDQSATLVQINNKWKITTEDSFPIGKNSGRWKNRNTDTHKPDDPVETVRIYTTSTSDILYIQPVKELKLTEDGVCTLAFALKRAIGNIYQVEENEIDVWMMGDPIQNILLYESAEGSLGILKDLMNNSRQLQKIFVEAYKLLGFDPDTHTDTKPTNPKASYDDLLSFYNQRYHEKLDRFSVKPALEKLMQCNIDNQQGKRTLEEQYKYLIEKYDLNSSTEKPLIEYLYKNGIQLPDEAQVNIPDLYVSADFVYKISDRQYALIFCDGNVHDKEEIKEADKIKRQNCRLAGYEVIEWHYTEPIEQFIERNKHIFRKVR